MRMMIGILIILGCISCSNSKDSKPSKGLEAQTQNSDSEAQGPYSEIEDGVYLTERVSRWRNTPDETVRQYMISVLNGHIKVTKKRIWYFAEGAKQRVDVLPDVQLDKKEYEIETVDSDKFFLNLSTGSRIARKLKDLPAPFATASSSSKYIVNDSKGLKENFDFVVAKSGGYTNYLTVLISNDKAFDSDSKNVVCSKRHNYISRKKSYGHARINRLLLEYDQIPEEKDWPKVLENCSQLETVKVPAGSLKTCKMTETNPYGHKITVWIGNVPSGIVKVVTKMNSESLGTSISMPQALDLQCRFYSDVKVQLMSFSH